MSMSKKDYEKVASVFRKQLTNPTIPSEARVTLVATVYSLAEVFAEGNPRFDAGVFALAAFPPAKEKQ